MFKIFRAIYYPKIFFVKIRNANLWNPFLFVYGD